uniref:Mucin 15 n=1 Tax=Jaculus jaculus TaxID=51337 RepID=A0A8C5LFZ8_JACJA
MLTLAKIVLISILFLSLPFSSHEKENLGRNTTQSMAKEWKLVENMSIPLERKENVHSDNENRNDSNSKGTDSPLFDVSSLYEIINSTNNLPMDNSSEVPRLTSTFSTIPSLAHGFVSKLPLNSSLRDENLLPASTPPNSVHTISSENFTWSLDNGTMNDPDNSSPAISLFTPALNATAETPFTMEPTRWITTSSDNFADFTPYQEKTTLQPTTKFTNNSKLFPNTSDPPKESRSTGIVFGAILGAILGASLLSLVGYLLCGKRKTDSFSHRRLYDDRNEPVLRLDNAPEPYDVNLGDSSYYNPTVNASSMAEGGEFGPDSIPMGDISPHRTSM